MYASTRTLTQVQIVPASLWQKLKAWVYRDLDRSFMLRRLSDWLQQRSPVVTDKVRLIQIPDRKESGEQA
jgi:hypothetical protein